MHGYRAYIIGRDGHIVRREEFFCQNDEEAKERAKQFVDGHAVELWEEARKIARFGPTLQPPDPSRTEKAREAVQEHIDSQPS
jgi:hypothetical protein